MDKQSITVVLLLISTTLGYLAVRRSADLTHWGQYVSMLCVLALAGVAIPSRESVEYVARKQAPSFVATQPTFAGINPIEAKALELQWFTVQQRRSHK